MPRYYFDIREGDEFFPDEEGIELRTLQAVQEEAARSLADLARDAARNHLDGLGSRLAIEVRDDKGAVMQLTFTFELKRHAN
jgi:hypothetical protein